MRRRIRNTTRRTTTGHVGYLPNTVHHARRIINYFLEHPKEQLTETVIAYRCYIQGPTREVLSFLENMRIIDKKKDHKLTNVYQLNPAYQRFYKRNEQQNSYLSKNIN